MASSDGRRDPFSAGISRKARKVTDTPINTGDWEGFIDADFHNPNFLFCNHFMTNLWVAANPEHNFFKRGGSLDDSFGHGLMTAVVFAESPKTPRNLAFPFTVADMQRALTVLRTAHTLGIDHRVLA